MTAFIDRRVLVTSILASFALCSARALPAFPGAEGAGASAMGGRGGDVYFVTTTNNSGAGSLRSGISGASGPRTIIFRVSGNIDLATDLNINRPYITIAGQTAPGDGITLRRRSLRVSNTHNVVIRHLRVRPGDLDPNFEGDALWVTASTNIILDHVSTSWSVDECLSVTHSTNVTVQWCMISESLRLSQHEKGAHGYGSLLRYGAGELTFHHNLYQHHDSRNPRLGDRIKLDFVNNVLYNWGGTPGYSANDNSSENPNGFTNYLNYVGNYLLAGPSSSRTWEAFRGGHVNTYIYGRSNLIDSDRNLQLNGVDTGINMFSSAYTLRSEPYPLPSVNTDPASTAYQRVLAFAGASRVRDSVDQRLIATVRSRTGRLIDAVGSANQLTDYITNNIDGVNYVFVRGWPVLNGDLPPLDTDDDGIPDYFELALRWNPFVPNNNHVNGDGYTDLEWYLNWLAEPNAVGGIPRPIEVNLQQFVGGLTNLSLQAVATTNGTVALREDGRTAEFTPVAGFKGLTRIEFWATNAVDRAGFGPVAVTVLVTNSPNSAPVLEPIADRQWVAGAMLSVTNVATDGELPYQLLKFELSEGPAGAELDADSGVLTWRPGMVFAGTTNRFTVRVFDDGLGSLAATQAFTATVLWPARPALNVTLDGDGFPQLRVEGDVGPDYIVEASTNLLDWFAIGTNTAPAMPGIWTEGEVQNGQRFYRVLLGP